MNDISTKQLERLWQDWHKQADEAMTVLYEQTAALTLRDMDRIEEISPRLEAKMALLAATDAQAVEEGKRLAFSMECEPKLDAVIQQLPESIGTRVRKAANDVIVKCRKMQSIIDKNQRLIENELEYQQGTMALVCTEVIEQRRSYGDRHRGVRNASILIDQAA